MCIRDSDKVVWAYLNSGSHDLEAQATFVFPHQTRGSFQSWENGETTARRAIQLHGILFLVAEYHLDHYLQVISPYGQATGEGWYGHGTVASFATNPVIVEHGNGTRHVFLGWRGDYDGTGPSASLLVDRPKIVMSAWKTQYYLKLESAYGSTSGIGWYDANVPASFSVSPTSVPMGGVLGAFGVRYVFASWSGDQATTSSNATILMYAPKTVTALWRTDYTQLYMIVGAGTLLILFIVAYKARRRHHSGKQQFWRAYYRQPSAVNMKENYTTQTLISAGPVGRASRKFVVDRAGFEPATFRTLEPEFAKRTIFGPEGIPD